MADEAVVVMKRRADEDVVTRLRIKLFERGRTPKMKGWNMNSREMDLQNLLLLL